ncbi:2',3'-cyclic-nucleotide 3'-phosphodiesterase [Phyllosticta citribraziliensis]|uniref:2',3'-cyclic-nucleotide 3'-phosphodiesterase n=1 Tax=Phyllosticta citribraziliensis TaxID=989973 RepID=A0ABR1LMQ0_9PEZI
MTGCSLWLVPPQDSPLYDKLSTLISDTLPAQFPEDASATPERLVTAGFVPHVTLTSDVPIDLFTRAGEDDEARRKADAQAWLDSVRVSLPRSSDVDVRFRALDVGDKFVQKLTLRVEKEGVKDLALWSRILAVENGLNTPAQQWADDVYRPHCSLIYGSVDISEEKKTQLQQLIQAAGVSIDGSGDLGGWKGGTVWLVPTNKPIPEWTPWAEVRI